MDEVEQIQLEMRWLANDWERRVREATEDWPMHPDLLKAAGQLRAMSHWRPSGGRVKGFHSMVDWSQAPTDDELREQIRQARRRT